jgi:excisionase family DNA binding protein
MDEITAAQAATLTGLSERTIRRKIASGLIPARRLATNRYAIKTSDLHASRPLEVLALRVEALEHRLDTLEAYLRQSHTRSDSTEPGTTAEVQQLFAQLAYEAARLVRSMPFPPSPELEPSGERYLPKVMNKPRSNESFPTEPVRNE